MVDLCLQFFQQYSGAEIRPAEGDLGINMTLVRTGAGPNLEAADDRL